MDLLREAFLGYVTDASLEIPCLDWFGHFWWSVSAVDDLGLQLRHDCEHRDFPDHPVLATTRVVEIPAGWLRDRDYGSLLGVVVGTIVTTAAIPGG
jgi:hypothetical protein